MVPAALRYATSDVTFPPVPITALGRLPAPVITRRARKSSTPGSQTTIGSLLITPFWCSSPQRHGLSPGVRRHPRPPSALVPVNAMRTDVRYETPIVADRVQILA